MLPKFNCKYLPMKISLMLALPLLLLAGCASLDTRAAAPSPYQNKSLSIEERVEDLLGRMTQEEKIDLLGGSGFATKAIERLGVPSLNMSDGPVGVRWGKSTSFPAAISMAATWDPILAEKVGAAIGEETKAKGRHLILGPCVNIARVPMGGRIFEGFGEDPYLTSRLAVGYINGVQKEHVAATVKHIAANNQEYQRDFVDVIVDERALNEIYLPPFQAAVEEANVLAVMSAYNKVNGRYCSENDYLLQQKVKKEWSFNGLIMSDWGAVHSSIPTFNGGLDLEMPDGEFLNRKTLLAGLKSGALHEETLNDKVRRILRVMFTLGLFDNYQFDFTTLNSDEHRDIAAEAAKAGIVLLKNTNSLLPIDPSTIQSIALIGSQGKAAPTGGGGSSMVTPFYSVSPLEAMRNAIGDKVKINFAQGYLLQEDQSPIESKFLFADHEGKESGLHAEYFPNRYLEGAPTRSVTDKQVNFAWGAAPPAPDFPRDNFSVRWTGYIKVDKTGMYIIDVSSDDGVRLYIDEKLRLDEWNDHGVTTHSLALGFKADKTYKIRLEYYEHTGGATVKLGWRRPNDNLVSGAVDAARASDVAIVFAGTSSNYESEGFDREDLALPSDQDTLIGEVARANKNTIVVLSTGGPVLMDKWADRVSGILEAWFAGEQAGNTIVEILLGRTNPSGKLPLTFPKRWQDCSAFGTYKKADKTTTYSDGIYVGYRHFEKHKIQPLFPFGFGLSYTTFHYSDLALSAKAIGPKEGLIVRFTVENTGHVKGAEVAQLYIKNLTNSIDHPEKELKRFEKIEIYPGEKKSVEFAIDEKALRFFDPGKRSWAVEAGDYEIMIGSSSEQIELKENFRLAL